MKPRILAYGPTAVLIEVHSTAEAMQLARWLRSNPVDGVVELVPAARSVLVECASAEAAATIARDAAGFRSGPEFEERGRVVTIEVVYDGDDLADVARTIGVSATQVIAWHSESTYVCAFCGFVPGFAYLTGLHPRLHLPRRTTPRPRVPAGSLAIATEFTSVYPTSSPGGWHLLGRTAAAMWDVDRVPPALIEPGDQVRFVAVSG